MEKYIDIIKKSNLFCNMNDKQIIVLLEDFKSEKKYFDKDNIIIDAGDKIDSIYIILKGKVEISKEYDDTRKNIVNILNYGDIFAEALAFSANKISSIQAISLDKTEILKINIKNIFNTNNNDKNIFLQNLLMVISDKNKFLAFKNDILSQKSLRSKIILYLKYMSNIQKSRNIVIPYNRDKLAEFISADRSALSRELNRLSKENIIKLDGSKITIIKL
ncbi:Crp/Fnr family transcriptional regulator [Brachyspira murdochii]|uniref:Transcriptional regulator, Crp/Fnr family n=2 Tax=Brachyspira TaxID=29521 RepID=D5U5Q8_BRAM5|nr:Crp/Fnr family transcriptional regulator [Brachyspira murdochii]ADG72535.1 transcriptional regulator, Crp/Fnr family [Brachyspira murdochii DSM 12563]